MQENQYGETIKDNVQNDRKRIKKIPDGARFSAPAQTCPGAYPVSYIMGTGSLSRG